MDVAPGGDAIHRLVDEVFEGLGHDNVTWLQRVPGKKSHNNREMHWIDE